MIFAYLGMGKWKQHGNQKKRGGGIGGNDRRDGSVHLRSDERRTDTERSMGSVNLGELQASAAWRQRYEYSSSKRKYALCFGYLGSSYYGLQANPGAASVEQQLERALFLAGSIQESNFGFLQKLTWSRAARTDRGVHAVAQCCAMKLAIPLTGQEVITAYKDGEAQAPVSASSLAAHISLPASDIALTSEAAEVQRQRLAFIDRVNHFLPDDIRLHTMSKVTKNFNAKTMCERRRYHYLLPTYMLRKRTEVMDMLQALYEEQGPLSDPVVAAATAASVSATDTGTDTGTETIAGDAGGVRQSKEAFLGRDYLLRAHASATIAGYRTTPAQLETLNATCKLFEGTHKYHNYTSGKAPNDANSKRFIVSFTCGEPHVSSASGVEYVLLTVVGQSFLLNQIRKMVGMVCEVVSDVITAETVMTTFSDARVEVSMTPSTGLYLDELFFTGYNHKMEMENTKLIDKARKDAVKAKEKEEKAREEMETEKGEEVGENATKKPRLESEASTARASAKPIEAEDAEAEGDAQHEFLEWHAQSHACAHFQAFRRSSLWPHIHAEEASSLSFMTYLDALRVYPKKYAAHDFNSPNEAWSQGHGQAEAESGGGGGGDSDSDNE